MALLDIFRYQNPWRETKNLETAKYVERDLFSAIVPWLFEKDILVILGPRQSGKTTILKMIIKRLLDEGKSPEDLFYFNLDSEELMGLFRHPQDLVKFVKGYQSKTAFVFIDEAQRVENAGLFLKNIHDLDVDLKLIVSGSSSLELRAKIKEYLTGRKKEFLLYPFSFLEFLRAKKILLPRLTPGSWSDLEDLNRLYGSDLLRAFSEYTVFGGYPKVALHENQDKKISELEEIYKSYIKKDIKDFLGVDDVSAFNKLVSLIAYQIGNLINKHELAAALGVSWRTIERYLGILEDTFVLKLVSPYSTNRRKEISRMPKGYYFDLGLRNFVTKNFSNLEERGDKGELAENFIFEELLKAIAIPQEICFWRTQAKAEVDFVVVSGEKTVPLEVKFTRFKRPLLTRSYKSFIEGYHPQSGIIFTRDFLGKIQKGELAVAYLPVYLSSFWLKNSLSF